MGKIQWKPGNMLYPLPAVIVTCGENEEEYNGITIAWTGTICTNPPMTYISVRPTRHSYDIIKRNMGFVINLTTEEMTFATDYLGVRSGAKEDKLSNMKLEYEVGHIVKAPLLKKSPVCLECKVVRIDELGSHHMFVAEVVQVHVEEGYIDQENKFHLDDSKPIVYSHGKYFSLGEQLGTFGYSVMKKKTASKKKTDSKKRTAIKKKVANKHKMTSNNKKNNKKRSNGKGKLK